MGFLKYSSTLSIILCLAISLQGCQIIDSQQPYQESYQFIKAPLPAQEPQPGELNQDSLFDLLYAEMALQQGFFEQSLERYRQQAYITQDPAVAERATRLAQITNQYDAAVETATLWSQLAPSEQRPIRLLGILMLQRDQYQQVLPWLPRLLEDPESSAARIISSRATDFPLEFANTYVNMIETVLQQQPDRSDLILAAALLHKRTGDYNSAKSLLDTAQELQPDDPNLIIQTAELYRSENQLSKGLAAITEGLRQHPDNQQLNIQAALFMLELGQISEAENLIYEQFSSPENEDIKVFMALRFYEINQLGIARNLLRSILVTQPEHADAVFYLGYIAHELNESENAFAYFEQVKPGEHFLNAQRFKLDIQQAIQYQSSVENIIHEAIEKDPDNHEQLTLLLVDWYQQHQLDSLSLNVLNQSLSEHTDSITLLYRRALLLEPSKPRTALDDLRKAHSLDPDNPLLQNALGYTLAVHTQDYDEAYDLISQALAQDPSDPATLDSMGWVLHQLNRSEEAIPYLREAYQLFPDPEVAANLARVLHALGQTEEAIQLLEMHLAEEPSNRHLIKASEILGILDDTRKTP